MNDTFLNHPIYLNENEINGEYSVRRYLNHGEIVSFKVKSLGNRRGIFLTSSNEGEAELHYSQLGNIFFDTEYTKNCNLEPALFGQVVLLNGEKHPILPNHANEFWNLVKGKIFKVDSPYSYHRYIIPYVNGNRYRNCRMSMVEFSLFVINAIKEKNFTKLIGYCRTARKYDFIEV